MRILDALRFFSGSVLVYVSMAACSGAGDVGLSGVSPPSASAGSSSGSSAGGDSGSGSVTTADATAPGDDATTGEDGGAIADSAPSSDGPVPDADAAEVAQSGSRLKATYFVGVDGSKQFDHWSDSARGGEACAFQGAGDGAIRCIPSGTFVVTGTYFSDAKCSAPVAQEISNCGAQTYYETVENASGGCPGAPRAHLFTGTVYGGTTYYLLNGTCTAVATGQSFVQLSAEIPPTSFVQATLVTDP